jgi:hypothetical protein
MVSLEVTRPLRRMTRETQGVAQFAWFLCFTKKIHISINSFLNHPENPVILSNKTLSGFQSELKTAYENVKM